MTYLLIALLVWYAIGAAIFLHVCWLIDPVLRVKDFLMALLGGLYGPVAALWYLQVDRINWLEKIIVRRRD